MRLLLFNPETEYALASGASFYTPPAIVEAMRKANQLLPERWASADDIILVDDVNCLNSRFRLADWNMLSGIFLKYPYLVIDPWGWNQALVRKLQDHGVPQCSLPDDTIIENIRNLAHRRTTILLYNEWNNLVAPDYRVDLPTELHSETSCIDYLKNNPGCWMKAPWSSSGRGVINTAADMSEEQVFQWCHGIIRRQGSVLGETAANRSCDFATEWKMQDGCADYLGLSCFKTSNRGKYISNDCRSQSELVEYFDNISSMNLATVIAHQKLILEKVLVGYSGPLGIDMIVETNGRIRPFVEMNLRRTMGMLNL